MPANRRAMRKIIDVLRLKFETQASHERIVAATDASKGTPITIHRKNRSSSAEYARMVGNVLEHLTQVRLGIKSVELRRSDHAVYRRRTFTAGVRAAEQVVLPFMLSSA